MHPRCREGGKDHLQGQGGHFQTHSEGHLQTQNTFESIFTARDIILGPKKPRAISKHTRGVIFKQEDKTRGPFQTQAYFLAAGTAFQRRLQCLSMYMHLLGSNWGAQCHPRQQIRPY